MAKIKTSLLNLVDLAGSERQRDTHAAGLRLKVSGCHVLINFNVTSIISGHGGVVCM